MFDIHKYGVSVIDEFNWKDVEKSKLKLINLPISH